MFILFQPLSLFRGCKWRQKLSNSLQIRFLVLILFLNKCYFMNLIDSTVVIIIMVFFTFLTVKCLYIAVFLPLM